MLHSALPRAYLGAYLGAGYFEDPAHHPYNVYAGVQHHHHHQQHVDSYVAAQRAVFQAWTSAGTQSAAQLLRPASPCPLDLSLKAAAIERAASPIEVDDEEDRRSREEARSHHSAESSLSTSSRYYPTPIAARLLEPAQHHAPHDEDVVVDDQDSRSSSHHSSTAGYHLLQSPKSSSEIYYQQQLHPGSPLSYQHQPPLMTPPPAQQLHAPMTPPSTPSPPQRPVKTLAASPQLTPHQSKEKPPRQKKKHARRLKFDEETSSPVSGTVILGPDEAVVTGDIDPAFNIVEVTEEARAELAKIENRLGPYQCKLCRQLHDDAFQLAQHRCSRIAHVEYRCPECDKRFSCPANLASHRRWHKPRAEANQATSPSSANSQEANLACTRCDAKFAKAAALRKHLAQQHPPEQNNNNNIEEHQPAKSAALAMEMA